MKRALCCELPLVIALIFLTPTHVWDYLLSSFPSMGYEYFCIGIFILLCVIFPALIVAGIKHRWFGWRNSSYFLIAFMASLTVNFCHNFNHYFCTAVLHGNLTTAEIMLHCGADINAINPDDGKTPLQEVLTLRLIPEAAGSFDPHRQELADWLIAHGATHDSSPGGSSEL